VPSLKLPFRDTVNERPAPKERNIFEAKKQGKGPLQAVQPEVVIDVDDTGILMSTQNITKLLFSNHLEIDCSPSKQAGLAAICCRTFI